MVIAVFGNLFTGFRCVGPFDCARDAISYCGPECYIMPIATFPYFGYTGPMLLVGNVVEGFFAYGPFRDKQHVATWKREQPAKEGVVYLPLPSCAT